MNIFISSFSKLFNSVQQPINNIEDLQSRTLNFLRFPLVLLVLFIHINPQNKDIFTPISTIYFSNISIENIYSIIGKTGTIFSSFAVPFFFFVSGFFFFYKLEDWNYLCYKKKISKRFKTLIIPYFLWNILAIFFIVIKDLLKIIIQDEQSNNIIHCLTNVKWLGEAFWNISVWNENVTNILGFSIPMSGPYLVPLWFLRDLIIVSLLLSPIIYYGIKHLKIWYIFLIAIAYLLNLWSISGMGVNSIFFFSLGAFFAINKINLVYFFNRGRYIYYFTTIISLICCILYDQTIIAQIFNQLYRYTAVASVISITSIYISKGKWKYYPQLSQTSFFIYALHSMVLLKFTCLELAISITEKIFLTKTYSFGYILSYLTSPFLGAFFCLIIFTLMKLYIPKCLGLLTGGRD